MTHLLMAEKADWVEGEKALFGKTLVVGVGGGIAAYKAAELIRLLRKAGAQVHAMMTEAARHFITPLTLQALSGNAVATSLFDLTQESEIGHIQLADRADLLVIAPATADLIGRLALGLGDDIVTTVALACTAPLLLAPAMNVNMWNHAQVQENLGRLVHRGAHTCGPDAGPLACGWVGQGRLVDPQVIVERAGRILALAGRADLAGRHVVVTAGPTYEAIDPVRFVGNRSTGKMGFAVAREAARRGARVTLVAGPVALPTPMGVGRVDVESADEMARVVLPLLEGDGAADLIVMAAAVADYRPREVAGEKLKKEGLGTTPTILLAQNVDILAELGRRRKGRRPVLVGFAAETGDLIGRATAKLLRKGCDLLVANDVSEAGSGFGTETNQVALLCRDENGEARVEGLPLLTKDEVAARILDRAVGLLAEGVGD